MGGGWVEVKVVVACAARQLCRSMASDIKGTCLPRVRHWQLSTSVLMAMRGGQRRTSIQSEQVVIGF
jgi:hypothetical protein